MMEIILIVRRRVSTVRDVAGKPVTSVKERSNAMTSYHFYFFYNLAFDRETLKTRPGKLISSQYA